MKRINENEIELLEKKLTQKTAVYKDFKNLRSNERYFYNLHYRTMEKLQKDESKYSLLQKPALNFAIIFLISFITSLQFNNVGVAVPVTEMDYLFSDNSLWIEEEDYISTIIDETFDLDFENYFDSEIDYFSNSLYSDEVGKLSERDFSEIYESVINKKIL